MTTEPVFPGVTITSGPAPWQVIQRNPDGRADVTLEGSWVSDAPGTVEVRVASECDNSPVPGCDWRDAEMLDHHAWTITLSIPTGGLYKIETRLRNQGAEWRLTGDKIWHVSVGDVWVIAGQSNAVGYGHGPVVDPAAFGVSVFGVNEVWRLATHPVFDTTGTRHPANRDSGWMDVSPWLAFGKEVLAGAGVPIGLIPTALGGSALSSWEPAKGDEAVLYWNMLEHITAAGGKVAGMLWYQGESDAGESAAPTYLERFTAMIEDFRTRFGDLPAITAQLNRYLDGLPEQDKWWGVLREAQRQAARSIPGLAVVPTLDLVLSDAIHTGAIGNVILGQRFARAALGMVYGAEIPWKPADVENAAFDNSERTRVRISFENVVDHLIFLQIKPNDFTFEDDLGVVPVESARVEGASDVLIELARPASGTTLCHNMLGCDPPCSLRDHLQRPVLAFYGIEVTAGGATRQPLGDGADSAVDTEEKL